MSAAAGVWIDPANRTGYFRLRRGDPEAAHTAKEQLWNYERLLPRVGARRGWITVHVMERCDYQFGNNPYFLVDVDHLAKILRRGKKTILRDLAWLGDKTRRILEQDPTRPGYYRALPENFETGPVLDPPKIPGRPRKAKVAVVSQPVDIAAYRQESPRNVFPPVAPAVATSEPFRPPARAMQEAGSSISVGVDPDAGKSISVPVASAAVVVQAGKSISADAVPCPSCNGTGVVTAARAVEIDFLMSRSLPVIETANRLSGRGKLISLTGEIGGREAEVHCPLGADCRCDTLHLAVRKPLSPNKPTKPATDERTEKVEEIQQLVHTAPAVLYEGKNNSIHDPASFLSLSPAPDTESTSLSPMAAVGIRVSEGTMIPPSAETNGFWTANAHSRDTTAKAQPNEEQQVACIEEALHLDHDVDEHQVRATERIASITRSGGLISIDNSHREATESDTALLGEATSEQLFIAAIASRIYALHPKRRRCGLAEICEHLAAIIHKLPKSERAGKLAQIERNHAGWCESQDWTKDGGQYAKGLGNWLAPTSGRYDEEPPVRLQNAGESKYTRWDPPAAEPQDD